MSRAPQSASPNPRGRRQRPRRETARPHRWPILKIALPSLLGLALGLWLTRPQAPAPLNLTYELDLGQAQAGSLVITLVAEGDLPRSLDLAFPPGVYAETGDGVVIHAPQAHKLQDDGAMGRPLDVTPQDDGWRLKTDGVRRLGVIYRIDLHAVTGQEQDVRRHISAPINGGLRAAGFEIFLQPVGHRTETLVVGVHNPQELPFLVPWPALLRSGGHTEPTRTAGQANLAHGLGYQPVPADPAPPRDRRPAAAPVPANLLYHPRNLADLNNALLICGDIRTATSQARDTVIQFATDREWLFPLDMAVDLVRRIARTQISFFGDAPTSQVTVLLAANAVTAAEGFDVYGLHTGSSVLVMLDPGTTWEQLQENAASVISHEMFHGWLGEALRQVDPGILWFTEGATTWYAARMLTAGGVWSPEHAEAILTDRLDRDYTGSDLLGAVPVAEAAAAVMADPARVRFAYAGGVAACAGLDRWLAGRSGLTRPLDEVMRRLFSDHRGSDLSRELLEGTVLEVTGIDCAPWLQTYVYGTAPVTEPSPLI